MRVAGIATSFTAGSSTQNGVPPRRYPVHKHFLEETQQQGNKRREEERERTEKEERKERKGEKEREGERKEEKAELDV